MRQNIVVYGGSDDVTVSPKQEDLRRVGPTMRPRHLLPGSPLRRVVGDEYDQPRHQFGDDVEHGDAESAVAGSSQTSSRESLYMGQHDSLPLSQLVRNESALSGSGACARRQSS